MPRFDAIVEKEWVNLEGPNREQVKEDLLQHIRREGITKEDIEVEIKDTGSDFVRVNDKGEPEIRVDRIASEVADEIARALDLSEDDFVEIRDEIEKRLGRKPLPLSTERLWLFGK